MPRRNIALLVLVAVISVGCYLKVNYYGRILIFAMEEIQTRALDEVNDRELFEGAMRGMTSCLDDYSVYIPPKQLTEFEADLDQEFGGLGIQILVDRRTKLLTVVTPLYGTPAHKAGIRAGDKVLRIDGVSTHGLSVQDAAERLRGKPGEAVVLTVQHLGQDEPVDVKMVRAIIQVDSVLGDSRDAEGDWNYFLEGHDRIGYLRIETFGRETVNELHRALGVLTKGGMRGLVLDVRNDPGGLLSAAVGTCNLFVDAGVIVTTRDRQGQIKREFEATGLGAGSDFPMAVLVNQYSASASEIVAACLQDRRPNTVVVGQRTYGKGTVQELIPLEGDLGALKLTTSSYWRPSGRNINCPHNGSRERGKSEGPDEAKQDDWGVKPNEGFEIVLDEAELVRLVRWRKLRDASQKVEPDHASEELDPTDLKVDRQLAKAVEYVERAAGSKQRAAGRGQPAADGGR